MTTEVTVNVDPEIRLANYNTRGLTSSEVEELRLKYGFNEVTAEETPEWIVFLLRFTDLIPVICLITCVLSLAIEENGSRDYLGFAILLFDTILLAGSAHYSDRNAKSALETVRKLGTPMCHVRRDGTTIEIETRELVPGDIVIMRAGVIIPADGYVIGKGMPMSIDESALTGETIAATKGYGAEVLSGAVVQRGELDIVVTATGNESSFGKTVALIASVQNPGNLRIILGKATHIITGAGALFCVALFFVILFRDDHSVGLSIKLTFVILAAVAPTAMPVVTATVLAVGSKVIASENALVQRLSAIEEMAGMEILCSDKTGTLTKNKLELKYDTFHTEAGYTHKDLLLFGALASNVEHQEPIDFAITNGADMTEHAKWTIHSMIPFDPVNKKVIVDVTSPEGKRFRVIKGAPHIVRDITSSKVVLGEYDSEVEKSRQTDIINERAKRGFRTLGVCIETEHPSGFEIGPHDVGVCKLVGYVSMFDPPRDDTAQVIKEARELGVEVKMVTGDQLAIAIETCRMLDMGTNIASSEVFALDTNSTPFLGCTNFAKYCESVSGFAGVFPEHKFKVVQSLMEGGNLIGMTGDGVNDAPALKAATVGIAVAGATEAANAAADIVLKSAGLSTIITAIKLSRQIFRRIESYIMYRIASSCFILFFFFISIVAFQFYVPTWVMLFISVVNDITIIFCSIDHVPTFSNPVHWNMTRAAAIGTTIGLMGTIWALAMFMFVSPDWIDWWHIWGLKSYKFDDSNEERINGLVVSAMYVCIGILIQTNFLLCRARSFWFMFDKVNLVPHRLVATAMTVACLIAIVIGVLWSNSATIGGGSSMWGLHYKSDDHTGLIQAVIIVGTTLLWTFVSDAAKVFFIWSWDKQTFSEYGVQTVALIDPKSDVALDQKKALKAQRDVLQRRHVEAAGVDNYAKQHENIISRMASNISMAQGDGSLIHEPHGRVIVRRNSEHHESLAALAALAVAQSEIATWKVKCATLEARVGAMEAKLDAILDKLQ